jgi:ParB family transcriptional regulator, chromosome partitioning protein
MELELHQLELRYERLRKRAPAAERALLGALAEHGQKLPIVVVETDGRYIVIDGYKRLRALKRLSRDTVMAADWRMTELDALLLERRLRASGEDALDQAWLLAELRERFGLSMQELAERFDRSKSWVSRRLGLIEALPPVIQDQVRGGALSCHAAMKYLLPLARANGQAATQLGAAIAPLKLSSRQVGTLYAGWQAGGARTRELIVERPQVYLQARSAEHRPSSSSSERWRNDLNALAAIARRARRVLQAGLLQQLLAQERAEIEADFERMREAVHALLERYDQERGHA